MLLGREPVSATKTWSPSTSLHVRVPRPTGGVPAGLTASGVATPSSPGPVAAAPCYSPATAAVTAAGSGAAGDALAPEAHPWHERFDVLEDQMIHKR